MRMVVIRRCVNRSGRCGATVRRISSHFAVVVGVAAAGGSVIVRVVDGPVVANIGRVRLRYLRHGQSGRNGR